MDVAAAVGALSPIGRAGDPEPPDDRRKGEHDPGEDQEGVLFPTLFTDASTVEPGLAALAVGEPDDQSIDLGTSGTLELGPTHITRVAISNVSLTLAGE